MDSLGVCLGRAEDICVGFAVKDEGEMSGRERSC